VLGGPVPGGEVLLLCTPRCNTQHDAGATQDGSDGCWLECNPNAYGRGMQEEAEALRCEKLVCAANRDELENCAELVGWPVQLCT
jgi:hypothetical protein